MKIIHLLSLLASVSDVIILRHQVTAELNIPIFTTNHDLLGFFTSICSSRVTYLGEERLETDIFLNKRDMLRYNY